MGNRSGREEGDPEGGQAFGMAVEETVSHIVTLERQNLY